MSYKGASTAPCVGYMISICRSLSERHPLSIFLKPYTIFVDVKLTNFSLASTISIKHFLIFLGL